MPYLFSEEFKTFLDNRSPSNNFSIFLLNIRSIKKNFENFKLFLKSISFTFIVTCFSETWLDDLSTTKHCPYELPDYTSNHQIRSDHERGGVSIYIHKTFDFKTRPDLSVNNKDIEAITVESNKKWNSRFNIFYRPPCGEIEPFETFLNSVFSQTKSSNKTMHIADDFSSNLLHHVRKGKYITFSI